MIEALGVQIGSVAQLGTFLTVLAGVLGLFIKFRGQTFDHSNTQVKQYEETCKRLRDDVSGLVNKLIECERKCDEDIKALHEEMWGMRKQNLAEQISLINVIISSVDAPELKTLLRSMESVQVALVSPRNTNPSRVRNTPDDEGTSDDA